MVDQSTDTSRLALMGAPGSPYTRKMLALLRYRRIPYTMLWGSHRDPPEGLPEPAVKLLPTFYFPKAGDQKAEAEFEAVVDSTPIIRRLEAERSGRSVLPEDPALGYLNDLVEDFADEWLTKAMFHFRWAHKTDADNAGPMLIFWSDPTLPDDKAAEMSDFISKRQIDRLYVVGSNDVTAATIEESYGRLLDILDRLVQAGGYVFGSRPSSADFAIYGQLTQLGVIEPTSAAITQARTRRVRAWIDRVEDLSGLDLARADWIGADEAKASLAPLLAEIGRVYVPFLLANAEAVASGQRSFEAEIDGRPWTQPTFPYQAKCLRWLREGYAALPDAARDELAGLFAGTGCEPLTQNA
ncbi:MAG: glutathione S-transferase N-terminal domain-containing protein [Hyphomonadaceae bacterium]